MRRPLAVAGLTAFVSCGLLALALWKGWLGPDAGRGAGFCEAARAGLIHQPANTLSNAGFVLAGLLIAWHARRDNGMTRSMATAMACLVVLLGPGSAAMHATQSAAGGHLDMTSMYLIAAFAAAYAAARWLNRGTVHFAVFFIAGVAFGEIAGQWGPTIPVVMTSGNAAFALMLLTALALELLLLRRGDRPAKRVYGYASVATLLSAFAIWNASKEWLCDPHSLIQGHAIWHALCAVAAYLLYRFYASEQAASQASGNRDA